MTALFDGRSPLIDIREHADVRCGFFNAPQPPAVLLNRESRVRHLPFPSFSTQLRNQLEYLAEASCAHRVPLRSQAS